MAFVVFRRELDGGSDQRESHRRFGSGKVENWDMNLSLRNAIMSSITAFMVALWLSLISTVMAQDAVPEEILQRTVLIKVGNSVGTAFSIDYEGKLYLVTAKHVVSGLPESNATIQVRRGDRWDDVHTVKTLFPPSSNVDIVVFETNERVKQPFEVAIIGDTGGPAFGQQVWFLGYPWGIHTRASNRELPFIKRGTMSAIDATDTNAMVLYIDGFNNPGFSGGPILYWDFGKHGYRLMGVVQGYRNDTAKVLVNGQQVDTNLLVNSGILVGYSIEHAIQAIQRGQKGQP